MGRLLRPVYYWLLVLSVHGCRVFSRNVLVLWYSCRRSHMLDLLSCGRTPTAFIFALSSKSRLGSHGRMTSGWRSRRRWDTDKYWMFSECRIFARYFYAAISWVNGYIVDYHPWEKFRCGINYKMRFDVHATRRRRQVGSDVFPTCVVRDVDSRKATVC